MELVFTPRISGGFVHHVMNDADVEKAMLELGINKETGHNLIKEVIIKAFTDYKVDINEVINNVRYQSTSKDLDPSSRVG